MDQQKQAAQGAEPSLLSKTLHEENGEGFPMAISIAGKIGTGKSTLVKDAMKHGLIGSVEHINYELLSDYVREPAKHAYTLQLCAMQGACVRTQIACHTASIDKRTMVIERAAQENIIFAAANRDAGFMTQEQFKSYLRYVKKDLEKCHTLLRGATYVNLMLWANEGETLRRMIDRGDLSEKAYNDDYIMERLPHCYFRATLESLTPNLSPDWYNLHRYFVIDWNSYGSWDKVSAYLDENDTVLNRKTRKTMLIQFVPDDDQATTKADPYWYETDDDTVLHMDLNWYEKQSTETHKHQRAVFRDKFFDALSKMDTIVMHYSKDEGSKSAPTYRHVYGDI